MVKATFFDSKKITLSGLEAPDVTPVVKGPFVNKCIPYLLILFLGE